MDKDNERSLAFLKSVCLPLAGNTLAGRIGDFFDTLGKAGLPAAIGVSFSGPHGAIVLAYAAIFGVSVWVSEKDDKLAEAIRNSHDDIDVASLRLYRGIIQIDNGIEDNELSAMVNDEKLFPHFRAKAAEFIANFLAQTGRLAESIPYLKQRITFCKDAGDEAGTKLAHERLDEVEKAIKKD